MAKIYTEQEFNKMDNATLIKVLDDYPVTETVKGVVKQPFRDNVPAKVKVRYFVSKYGNDLAAAIKGSNLYFSAVAAQKIAESAYGKSELTKLHNNFGGVKALANYPKVAMDTVEVVKGKRVPTKDYFAKFPSPKEAFASYVRLLKGNPRYSKVFTAPTPEDQIKELAKAGYTTESPSSYLTLMQGNINRIREMYPTLGKII